MNRNPLISIVLPTYNVAPYLLQCLDSINNQTYSNYEVIIIIDGATDGSYEIAKQYCSTNPLFKVYWQQNAGSGPARNNGMNHSNGELIMFVDPDDWLEPDLLEKLYFAQQEGDYDLVATKRTRVICNNDGKPVKVIPMHYEEESIVGISNVRNAYMRMLRENVVGAPTQKLYKLSLIKQFNIVFPDFKRSQDVVFNYRYYNYVKSIRLISYSGYNYRVLLRDSSGRSNADYYKIILAVYNDYKEMYKSWGMDFPEQEVCDFLFSIRIYSNFQRCASQKWDIKSIAEEPTIHHIISTAKPYAFYMTITKWLILMRQYKLLTVFLHLIVIVKQRGLKK